MLDWHDLDDNQLLQKAKEGEADAFGELYERHVNAVYRGSGRCCGRRVRWSQTGRVMRGRTFKTSTTSLAILRSSTRRWRDAMANPRTCSACGMPTDHDPWSSSCAEMLQAQRDEAWVERDRWIAEHNAVVARMTQTVTEATHRLISENDRLRALLREVEWAGPSGFQEEDAQHCLYCPREKYEGHAPDCRLAAALEGRDG